MCMYRNGDFGKEKVLKCMTFLNLLSLMLLSMAEL